MIELTHKFTPHSRLMEGLVAQGARAIEEELFQIEDDVVNEVRRIINDEFDNSREGFRSKGEEHLIDTIEAQVTSAPGQFPVILTVWSTADEAKVASLEFGARPHFIFPTDAKFLYFPSSRIARRKTGGTSRGRGIDRGGVLGPGRLAKGGTGSRGGKGTQLAKVFNVHHPGNRPFHFLRRGLQTVVRRRLGG